MHTKIRYIIFLVVIAVLASQATEVKVESRDSKGINWILQDFNTSSSANPSNLKFYRFYDQLPDDITLKLFAQKNLSILHGKKLYVGYGVIDPSGKNCKIFLKSQTGLPNNVTVCLPWWRIERTYEISAKTLKDGEKTLRDIIPEPHPPKLVNVCKQWKNGATYPGGKVTCTVFYSKTISPGCYDNPKQPKCEMTNCSQQMIKQCSKVEGVVGDKTTLVKAEYVASNAVARNDIVGLSSVQFNCPAGAIVPHTQCLNQVSALMYPYQCKPPDSTHKNGLYIYCDKNKPQYAGDGSLLGFMGKCPDGRNVFCKANTISEKRKVCIEPITGNVDQNKTYNEIMTRNYTTKTVDVLSGEPDSYADNPNCIRDNTIEASRQNKISIHIVGAGQLDDDIWVFRHLANGSKTKVYCNEQHNENHHSRKDYDGTVYQCIDNNGNYSFDHTLYINNSDIVSVQQATERENANGGIPFSPGRTNYRSTKVTIDNILVAPETMIGNYPYYPNDGNYLKLWENTDDTLSLLFPYAGAYNLTFWGKDGQEIAEANLGINDFRTMKMQGYLQLKLAYSMQLAPGLTKSNACLDDAFVEWGGGVYGGRNSTSGNSCHVPDDSFSKNHAVYTVIVKDLFTGVTTRVPLVYPIVYPNRIYISKLHVYEHRIYHCYEPFTAPKM